jgi:hypothetical protein
MPLAEQIDAPPGVLLRHILGTIIRHTAPLRPGCRSIPPAKFRHSGELISATKTALDSPLKGYETSLTKIRLRQSRVGFALFNFLYFGISIITG